MPSRPTPFSFSFSFPFPFRCSYGPKPILSRVTHRRSRRTQKASSPLKKTELHRTMIKTDGIKQEEFRPISSLRPENDIRFIKVFVKTSNVPSTQLESASIALKHDTLFVSLQKEIRPGRSVFDIGESVINDAFISIPKATTIKLEIWPNMGLDLDRKSAVFLVERNDMPEYNREGQCARSIVSAWTFYTMIKSIRIKFKVKIQTTETCTGDTKTVVASASEKPLFPQESKTAVSTSAAEDPMHGVHKTLIDRLKGPHNINSQASAWLAKLAYKLSDERSKGSRLTAVSIEISAQQIGRHGATANMRSELSRSEYENSRQASAEKLDSLNDHLAYIALGSNVGDRIAMLDLASRELDRCGIHVVRTSALYETAPMYLQEQRSFLNGACEVRTSLKPFDLLDKLKEIETALGRQKTVENGPRAIDLDILLYDDKHIDHERLIIPHKRMLEREFVLRPLCDLIPEATLPPPLNSATFSVQLHKLPQLQSPLSPLTPLSPKIPPISSLSSTRSTLVMAILNLTPDSFSDGNLHPTDPVSLLPTLEGFLSADVSILDIGGQSTRPHAPQITVEEEISRVLPTIKFIRSQPAFDRVALSIDTYRASVADAAISAGANIVNDVSAGRMDGRMLSKIAELGCTVILMHMRGTPSTMTTLTEYPSGVLDGVGSELLERVAEAEQAGIRRWRIMLDPGIGFAKNETQNLELLRHFGTLREYPGLQGLPWTVGASRKQFIGSITGVKTPRERSWGTAATITAAIQGGADIVRVHDAVQMAQVAKMADAIWRV